MFIHLAYVYTTMWIAHVPALFHFLEFSHEVWNSCNTGIPVIPEPGGVTAGMYTESTP